MVKPRTWVRNNATHFQDDFGWKSSPNPAPPVSLLVWFSEWSPRKAASLIWCSPEVSKRGVESARPRKIHVTVQYKPISTELVINHCSIWLFILFIHNIIPCFFSFGVAILYWFPKNVEAVSSFSQVIIFVASGACTMFKSCTPGKFYSCPPLLVVGIFLCWLNIDMLTEVGSTHLDACVDPFPKENISGSNKLWILGYTYFEAHPKNRLLLYPHDCRNHHWWYVHHWLSRSI